MITVTKVNYEGIVKAVRYSVLEKLEKATLV